MVKRYWKLIVASTLACIGAAWVFAWIETTADGFDFFVDLAACLFLIAALNGLIAYYSERKGSERWRKVFADSMTITAIVGVICLMLIGLISILFGLAFVF